MGMPTNYQPRSMFKYKILNITYKESIQLTRLIVLGYTSIRWHMMGNKNAILGQPSLEMLFGLLMYVIGFIYVGDNLKV